MEEVITTFEDMIVLLKIIRIIMIFLFNSQYLFCSQPEEAFDIFYIVFFFPASMNIFIIKLFNNIFLI